MEQTFHDSNYIRLYGKLSDKFGDNGIVSVVVGKVNADTLHIELWLMSCRVLKRDFEYTMLNELVKVCQGRGIKTIVGYYYKTSKNAMVKNLFGDFGFTLKNLDENENSVWELDVNSYTQKPSTIKVEKNSLEY
jgi:FkbH-like protein